MPLVGRNCRPLSPLASRHRYSDGVELAVVIDEHVHASAAVRQAAALTDFADKPLVVLTAGSGHDAARTTAQNHLATLSTDSVHRVIVLTR